MEDNILEICREFEVFEKGGRHYAPVGSEYHGRPSFILWVNRNVPVEEREDDGEKEFFISGADVKIAPVKSGSPRAKNLIPAKGWHTVRVEVPAGYRGESKFRIYRGKGDPNPIEVCYDPSDYMERKEFAVAPFAVFHSERGSLGVSVGAIISTPLPHFLIEWERDGRLYGEPSYGVSICYPERGEVFDYPNVWVEDIEDIDY